MTPKGEPEARRVPDGRFVVEDGIEWYRIDDHDHLDPFLVTLVTPTDQWMFVSSSGALTAGRESAQSALFPYETDDRLHRSGGRVGPVTMIRVDGDVWEPFAPHAADASVSRSIAKTASGDRLRFEERHAGLGLTFRSTWAAADRFGFVRTSELEVDDDAPARRIEVLDGLLDVLPAGVDLPSQQTSSTLVDGYRRSELDEMSGAAVFTLEALVSDRAEPAESLGATVVWATGLPDATVILSDRQLHAFRSGATPIAEHLVKGRKGSYLLASELELAPGSAVRWSMVADTGLDHLAFSELRTWLRSARDPQAALDEALAEATSRLLDIVAAADGLQETADRTASVHHFANVLFNVMRGGVFLGDHRVTVAAVGEFIRLRNRVASDGFDAVGTGLAPVVEISELREAVAADADLARLVDEYLPLSFSRRHGDPSRPWNTFRISLRSSTGGLTTRYEGNWRDIFQNWEALLHSFPEYTSSVVAKFLNASTVDGFNPYRITDRGIDWEMPEEGHWANLGYWGDHQIAYLYELLDVSDRFHPGALEADLGRVSLSYADVPYRLVPYDDIVADPKATILFDQDRQGVIEERVAAIGEDGRLVPAPGGGVHLASLAEKLLVPVLSKLSNLVAGSGIWMNTQRPEWNDANNALVGYGVSAVTLFYLRDYVELFDRILENADTDDVPVAEHVAAWMEGLMGAFVDLADIAAADSIDPADRRRLLDRLGEAFSDYRSKAYEGGPGPAAPMPISDMRRFLSSARPFLDQVVRTARRDDGLVDSYSLMHLEPGVARLEPLYEMLEGQVALFTEPDLGSDEALRLIDTMFASRLYRPDQHTFMLYPNRDLPSFWEKNVVPEPEPGTAAAALLEAGSPILRRDAEGVARFSASFHSERQLREALEDEASLTPEGRAEILDLYETVFRHAAFTGRSGTMYRYEGLGSVYWHMVSKLLLAVQERVVAAVDAEEPADVVSALADRYFRIRSGLGYQKDVVEQGTFPTDPHSHTPAHTGAQQPGMTGQVKEGVLLRWGELGVVVRDGRVRFRPVVLERSEFLGESRSWAVLGDGAGLEAGSLGFTYCGVPVVYHLERGDAWSRVTWSDGRETSGPEILDTDTSTALFSRRGLIDRIDVGIPESWLRSA